MLLLVLVGVSAASPLLRKLCRFCLETSVRGEREVGAESVTVSVLMHAIRVQRRYCSVTYVSLYFGWAESMYVCTIAFVEHS